MNKKTTIIILIVAVVVIIGLFMIPNSAASRKLDGFAACLEDKGAIMYGAYWCPHCQSQKRLFGASQSKVPYVECALPSGNGQSQECIDAGIEQYPTWVFADGSRVVGEMSLAALEEKTSCDLPQE